MLVTPAYNPPDTDTFKDGGVMTVIVSVVRTVCVFLFLAGACNARAQQKPAFDPPDTDTVRAVIGSDGSIRYYVPDTSRQLEKRLKREPFVPAIDFSAFQSQEANSYKVFSPSSGRVAGYWIGEKPESAIALGPGWQIEPRGAVNVAELQQANWRGWVPSLSKEAMAKLSSQPMDQATQLACNDRIRPEDVSITASIGVVEIAMTWKTQALCGSTPKAQ